jgi:hypothetical protein
MTPSGGGGPPYEVQCSARDAQAFKQIHQQAAQVGAGAQVVEAIRTVYEQLQTNPSGFGDPLYRLRALKLEVRVGIVPPLVVHFAISEDEPLVFIKGVKTLPGQPW